MSSFFRSLSDGDLLKRLNEARDKAHDAPHSDGGSDAWARFSREYSYLVQEVERRSLLSSPRSDTWEAGDD